MTISGSIPGGQLGQVIDTQLKVTGGVAPYIWVIHGAIGLTIEESTGRIWGSLTQVGPVPVSVQVIDARRSEARAEFTPVGRLGPGPIGTHWVHRDGNDVVVAGPGPDQRRRIPLPGIPGSVRFVSPNGRWAVLQRDVNFSPTWMTVDLDRRHVVGNLALCNHFSPNSVWAACTTTDGLPSVLVFHNFTTGISTPATITQVVGGWLDNSTMWVIEHLPNNGKRLRSLSVSPTVRLGPVLLEFEASHVVEMLDAKTAIAITQGGLWRISASGTRQLLADGKTSCVVKRTKELLACIRFELITEPVAGGKVRYTFPWNGTVQIRNARTGALIRSVSRKDCVPFPARITDGGAVITRCTPLTAQAMGARTLTVSSTGIDNIRIGNAGVLGKTVIIGPAPAGMTVGPRLGFDAESAMFD